jgi:hypothetical protein
MGEHFAFLQSAFASGFPDERARSASAYFRPSGMNVSWFYPLWGEGDCLALRQDNLLSEALVVGHPS